MRFLHFSICLLFISIFSANHIQAQNHTSNISGIIIDKSTNLPLFYVNTGLLNAADSTVINASVTNKDGFFTFSNIKSGNYIIKTSYIGYDIYEQFLSVDGENREVVLDTIFLQPTASQLAGITISTTKPVYMNDGEKIVYNVSEDSGVQTGTIADALQNAPGVEVDIEGNITLRGVSSVKIWINNKPSKLNAENLKTYIQQMPANSLEKIEVITNPSARYSAEGSAGVINIVTQSNILKNSFFSFGVNGSTRPMLSPWLSYMFSNEKFSINVYTSGYYSFWKNNREGYNTIFNDNMDTVSVSSYTENIKGNYLSTGGHINASYNIDSLKTISFWGGVWFYPYDKSSSSQSYKRKEYIDNPGMYDYNENAAGDEQSTNGYFSLEYEHNFNEDGHTFTTEISSYYWKDKETGTYNKEFVYYPELNKNRKTLTKEMDYGIEANIDYVLPYNDDGEFSAGINSSFNHDTWLKRTDTLSLFSDDFYLDSMRFENYVGNNMQIDAYITAQHTFGNFTLKGGLRFQNCFINYNILNQPEHNGYKYYPGLFPSLHLSYKTKKMHNFNLSYTRRISYPDAEDLNTFIIYDEDCYETGNKDLVPTYTNSIEGGWTKYFEKFGSIGLSAYFKNNKDEINYLTDVIYNEYFGRYVYYDMPVNSGKSHRYGADLNVMYKLKAFMNIRFNASVYQLHSETLFRDEEEPVITDGFTYSFRLVFWAKLWKFLEVNASGNYRSKYKSIFVERAPIYSLNCGLRADFWEKKISVFLNVQDIFNWLKNSRNTTNPYYNAYSSTKYSNRYIGAGITFRFGKMELAQQAKSGENSGGNEKN